MLTRRAPFLAASPANASSVEAACRAFTYCQPLSGISCRPAGTAHRVPTPMDRSVRHTPKGTPHKTRSAEDMARSLLFKERTAGVPKRLMSYHLPALTKVSTSKNREFPCAGPTRSSTPYSPHIDPRTASTARVTSARLARSRLERPEGAPAPQAQIRLTDTCNPLFCFQRRLPAPRVADGSLEGQALRSPTSLSVSRQVDPHRACLACVE